MILGVGTERVSDVDDDRIDDTDFDTVPVYVGF